MFSALSTFFANNKARVDLNKELAGQDQDDSVESIGDASRRILVCLCRSCV
jgi:hypothetical protein